MAETLPGSRTSSPSVSDVATLPRKQAPNSSVDSGQSGGRDRGEKAEEEERMGDVTASFILI